MPRLSFALVAILLLAPWRALNGAESGHNFAQWENEVAAYEAQDLASPPPKGALLFAGSSTIRMWTTLAADFPGHTVINRGFGGTEIVDSTHFADRLIFPHAPKVIYFRAGGNDLHNGKAPAQVFADFQEFVAIIHARLPVTVIWFIGWNPSIARLKETSALHELNTLVKDYCAGNPLVHYLDAETVSLDDAGQVRPELFRADMLHFNAAGYKLLAERVRPYVR
jgi:lysophospholipase L1-like esterase